jgi:hypothetical protein
MMWSMCMNQLMAAFQQLFQEHSAHWLEQTRSYMGPTLRYKRGPPGDLQP